MEAVPGFPMLAGWKELGGGVGLPTVPGFEAIEGGQFCLTVV